MADIASTRTKKRGSWNDSFKCDQIQCPPPGDFDSNSLRWEGSKKKIAWIPDHRLDDFIEGEERRENFNTTFWRQQRREYKYRGTGVIEKVYTWFHYTFGPEDLRNKLPGNGDLPDERLLESGQVYLRSTTH